MQFNYSYKKSTNQLNLVVSNGDKVLWQANYPSYTEDAASGEVVEDQTIIELGAMKSLDDIEGLKTYLLQQNIIQPEDTIIKVSI